jgi:predicted deacetylase
MTIHVSIHDVTPAFEPQIEIALELTRAAGAVPALLVVPDFHQRWLLARYPAFCARLRELEAAGHEILLHGYHHSAHVSLSRGSIVERLSHHFAQHVVSAGEAEFSDLDRAEANRRLSDGERVLLAAGLSIAGFVPPAWAMPGSLIDTLGRRGYAYSEDHLTIYDPKAKRSRRSLLLNYASRTRGRMWSTIVYCRGARSARRFFPARIAIHPADVEVPLLRRELENLLAWGRGDFVATSRQLFEHTRGGAM